VRVAGRVRVPGDKSITHRALIVAGLARGKSELVGALGAEDAKSTARVLRQLGATISALRADGAGTTVVVGKAWQAPRSVLNCGNSGTTARLILGALAGHSFTARLTGDASLKRRPMRRITRPLQEMGARITEENGDTLPLAVRGGQLRALTYTTPVASAQIKGALLLAGLTGRVPVTIREPYLSRDHTERLFLHLGLDLRVRDGAVVFNPSDRPTALPPYRLTVPGDASSAAFLVGAAALAQGGDLLIEHVGVNPTRTGFLVVLERMGAHIERMNLGDAAGEPVADLLVRPASLHATEVTPAEIPTLIDEVPILAVLAARAEGTTIFHQAGELRIKESDRLDLLARNIRAVGGRAEARGDDLVIDGYDFVPRGRVDTAGDHRLAMAFAVLGKVPGADVKLSERRSPEISFPGFFAMLRNIEDRRAARHRA
jgi:3-phosphoshikimate 1-carboxyvinyltransferase